MTTDSSTIEYKVTVHRAAECEGKVYDPAGIGYGHVWLRVEPIDYKSESLFRSEIVGNVVPANFVDAVESGVQSILKESPIGDHPTLGILVTLYDGSYHEKDSNDKAFYEAAKKACSTAIVNANPILLEPILEIKTISPEEYLGEIMGLFLKFRGITLGMEDMGANKQIISELPKAELDEFTNAAKIILGENIVIDVKFKRYDVVPPLPGPDDNEPSSMAISVA